VAGGTEPAELDEVCAPMDDGPSLGEEVDEDKDEGRGGRGQGQRHGERRSIPLRKRQRARPTTSQTSSYGFTRTVAYLERERELYASVESPRDGHATFVGFSVRRRASSWVRRRRSISTDLLLPHTTPSLSSAVVV
jgi:hypothetical protein